MQVNGMDWIWPHPFNMAASAHAIMITAADEGEAGRLHLAGHSNLTLRLLEATPQTVQHGRRTASRNEHGKDLASLPAQLLKGVLQGELRLRGSKALLLRRRDLDADQQLRGAVACAHGKQDGHLRVVAV